MPDLRDRVVAVLNVADRHSIGWAIARAVAEAGARLVIGYQNERFERNVRELAATLKEEPLLVACDATRDEDIERVFATVARERGRLDGLVHAMAYAPGQDLQGPVLQVSREGFRIAHDVSVYSLIALTRAARPLLQQSGQGSVLTLTYYGSEKVVPGYNLMGIAKAALEASVRYLASELGPEGIRVNAISAGPVRTLAARGVPGFVEMLRLHAERAPLRRRVDVDLRGGRLAERRVRPPDAEVLVSEVHLEQGVPPTVGVDPLVDVLPDAPATVTSREVAAQLFVHPLREGARRRIDSDPVVGVLDHVRARLEVLPLGRRGQWQEGVAEPGHVPHDAPQGRRRSRAVPWDVAREEHLEHADRRCTPTQLGLLDEHGAGPRQRVDH